MCIAPVTIRREADRPSNFQKVSASSVPCGVCVECLAKRRNAWSFRLHYENLVSTSAYFITLTYGENEDFGEEPPKSFNGIYTLDKKHLQDFFKRLRKYEKAKGNNEKLKYYAVGEYGTKNLRPHYHIILFNLSPSTALRSNMVAKRIWKKGNVDIAKANIRTINYTVGYVMQGRWTPKTDDDDRQPHFSTMSKGLGAAYFTEKMQEHILDRVDSSVFHPSGFRINLPRYYLERLRKEIGNEEYWEWKKEVNWYHQQLLSMDWSDFEKIDYELQITNAKNKIRQHERKNKETRAKV